MDDLIGLLHHPFQLSLSTRHLGEIDLDVFSCLLFSRPEGRIRGLSLVLNLRMLVLDQVLGMGSPWHYVGVFRNFVRPMNSTNPTQSRLKLVGSDFNWVGLGCKTSFSPLLGWVVGCHNDNPKQPNPIEHMVSNIFLCYTILCSLTQSLSPNPSTVDTSHSLPMSPMLISRKKKSKQISDYL